jgi:hypothetical protein
MNLFSIMSGGQTGVDRAALDAALALHVSCGGWCPAGRRAEDGPIPDRYPLTETAGPDYAERTLANVRDSDATLILHMLDGPPADPGRGGAGSAGTRLTARAAEELGRPLFVTRPDTGCVAEIADWIGAHRISVLNIAGPRESECPGIHAAARVLISDLLAAVAGR